MAIITSSSQTDARIGYKNLFVDTGVTVTTSSDQTGYEKENAYDWKQYDWWKPTTTGSHWLRANFASAKSADYMAIWGHNLHEVGGSVKPQYSTNGGTSWNDAASAVAPTNGNTIFIGFSSVSAADWRCLVVTTTGQSLIAGIMIGEATVFNTGMRPGFASPTISPKVEHKVTMSESGVNLGGSIKQIGIEGNIQLTQVSPSWIRSDWSPLITHFNNMKPGIFTWDYSNHNDEACLIWAIGQIPNPVYSSPLYMSASLPFGGIL